MAPVFTPSRQRGKYLKGYLAFHAQPFPYTHNLADLTELCAQIDASFRSLTETAAELTPFAVRLRYDDDFGQTWKPRSGLAPQP